MYNTQSDHMYNQRYKPTSRTQKYDSHNLYLEDPAFDYEAPDHYQQTIPRNAYLNNFSSNTAPERTNLFNAKIKYNPKFFDPDMFQKKYKGSQIILRTEAQLPQLSIAPALRAKVQKNLSHPTKKDSYIFITKQTGGYTSDKRFIIDEISYSTEEAIEESYYNENKYPVLLVTSPTGDYGSSIDMQNEIELIDSLCQSCRAGSLLSSDNLYHKRNTDFAVSNPDTEADHIDIQNLQSSDLLFLNMFRVFTFIIRSSNANSSKLTIHRLLYFPNVSFRISQIQQPFKLVSTPLANILTKKRKPEMVEMGESKPEVKFGFISLDANHRMLPIAVSDPLATQIPLIGIWIYGINPQVELLEDDAPEKRILQGILFEYINNSTLDKRYSFDKMKKMLLLAIFSPEDGSKFYETEFIETTENPELDNKWLMLKTSRETLNLADAMDHLERNFILSPESLVKDLSSLKRDLIEQAQNPVRESVTSTKRANNNDPNNSLSNYLFNNPQVQQQGSFRPGSGDEIDSFEMPNPQPLPQPQPRINQHLEESQKTAFFVPGVEQTFEEDSMIRKGKPIIPESLKKQSNPHMSQAQDSPSYSRAHSGEKLPPFAEQLLSQQAKHMEFLQEEIRMLRNLVTTYQTNAAAQQIKPQMVDKFVQTEEPMPAYEQEKKEFSRSKMERPTEPANRNDFAQRWPEAWGQNTEEFRKPGLEMGQRPAPVADNFSKPPEMNAYRRAELREQYAEGYKRPEMFEVNEPNQPKMIYNEQRINIPQVPQESYHRQYETNENLGRIEPNTMTHQRTMSLQQKFVPELYQQVDREPNFYNATKYSPIAERTAENVVESGDKRVLTDITNDVKSAEPRKENRNLMSTPSSLEYQLQATENLKPNLPSQDLSGRPLVFAGNNDTFGIEKETTKTKFNEESLQKRDELKKNVTFDVPETEEKPVKSGFTVLPPVDERNNSIKIPQSRVVDFGGDSDSDDEIIKRIEERYAARNKC